MSESALPIPGILGRVPADLAAVLVLTAATVVLVVVPGLRAPLVRIVLGTFFVLFTPGYAATAALFPEERQATDDGVSRSVSSGSIGGVERLTLSLGLSIAIVPLSGLVLNLSPLWFGLESMLTVLGGFTVAATLVAVRRRHAVAASRRFRIPYDRWLRSAKTELSNGPSAKAVPVLLIVASLLIAGVAISETVTSPRNAETYTEFYLFSEAEDEVGTATNYTTNLTSGEQYSIIVGIANQERRLTDYTVIVRLQRMHQRGNISTPVASETLTRFETTVAPNQTVERRTTFTPSGTGEHLRLQFLLYQGDPPDTPNVDTAYRETHLWVSVSESASNALRAR